MAASVTIVTPHLSGSQTTGIEQRTNGSRRRLRRSPASHHLITITVITTNLCSPVLASPEHPCLNVVQPKGGVGAHQRHPRSPNAPALIACSITKGL